MRALADPSIRILLKEGTGACSSPLLKEHRKGVIRLRGCKKITRCSRWQNCMEKNNLTSQRVESGGRGGGAVTGSEDENEEGDTATGGTPYN